MATSDNTRRTDANPDVKSANALDTNVQDEKELKKVSDFERKTGVDPDALDTRVVVDTGTPSGTFRERTSNAASTAPWADYQKEAERREDEKSAATQEELSKATKDADKE